jgi:hypothetical protein
MNEAQRMDVHNKTGGAVTALKGKVLNKSSLYIGVFQTFNGYDRSFRLPRQQA